MAKKVFWRINQQIRAPEARVIDEKGKMLGVMPTSQALEKAKQAGQDLVEIAPNAKPPVVKIIEFGKFKYQEEKKKSLAKSKSKAAELKEVRFSPFIGEADYQTRFERVKEFLSDGHKIKLVVKFKGRQMGSKRFGYQLFERILKEIDREKINVDMEPKFIGRHLATVISPKGKYAKKSQTKNKKINH